jgi:hypothetical protein
VGKSLPRGFESLLLRSTDEKLTIDPAICTRGPATWGWSALQSRRAVGSETAADDLDDGVDRLLDVLLVVGQLP